MSNWEDTALFNALRLREQPRRPVWLMRQAGRYLPEYRKVRQEAGGFLQLMKTPETACEVTLQPVRRFGMDAAIIFSDILTIPDAMGLGLYFAENEGPKFSDPLTDENKINAIAPPPMEKLEYVLQACQLTRAGLPPEVPLIGFCGSPWTLACYMIDGSGGDFRQARQLRAARPDLLRRIVDTNAKSCAALLSAQLAAGAQAVMIFDSWGGLLDGAGYEEFSLQPMADIIAEVKRQHKDAPVIVFSRQCGFHLAKIAACGCDAVGIDWQVPLAAARRMAAARVAIQGNLDPMTLLAGPEVTAAATQKMLEEYGPGPGHIVNLGHGIDKTTPVESVSAMIETVRNFDATGD